MPLAGAALAFALTILLWTAPRAAAAAQACSSDVFAIDGTSLSVSLCAVHPSPGKAVSLSETFSVKGQPPYAREIPLEDVGGAEVSRTIDDVPLGRLGLGKTLHLTIVYKAGAVRLEHALLVPGAVALK